LQSFLWKPEMPQVFGILLPFFLKYLCVDFRDTFITKFRTYVSAIFIYHTDILLLIWWQCGYYVRYSQI